MGEYFYDNGSCGCHKRGNMFLNNIIKQGVQINLGIHWRLLYRLRSMRHVFMNTVIALYDSLNILHRWLLIFRVSNWVYYFCIFISFLFKLLLIEKIQMQYCEFSNVHWKYVRKCTNAQIYQWNCLMQFTHYVKIYEMKNNKNSLVLTNISGRLLDILRLLQ